MHTCSREEALGQVHLAAAVGSNLPVEQLWIQFYFLGRGLARISVRMGS